MIKLDIFSDTICPWCYIGKKRLDKAIKKFNTEEFKITWRPFQLNPNMQADGMDRTEYLVSKFGSEDAAKTIYDNIFEEGEKENILFQFDDIKITPNSFNSHRLLALAYQKKIQNKMMEDLFQSYFIKGQDIGDPTVLLDIAIKHNIDEDEFKKLLSTLKIEETVSGGSVANSIVGLSQLGNDVGFIGKINADELGQKYEEGLTKEKVQYFYNKKEEVSPTGTCLILITPDAERTMVTFLGIAGKINENDIDEKAVKESEMIFLEGYLWDKGEPKAAFDKAMSLSNNRVMSLSDQFCVERHKSEFLDLLKNKLDITFANEQEIRSLIDAKSFEDIIEFGKQLGKVLIITRGEKGSVAITNQEIIECHSKPDLKIVDLTGAGDLFAAGFLHGFINNIPIKECLEKGTEMSSKIIQKVGARLD